MWRLPPAALATLPEAQGTQCGLSIPVESPEDCSSADFTGSKHCPAEPSQYTELQE